MVVIPQPSVKNRWGWHGLLLLLVIPLLFPAPALAQGLEVILTSSPSTVQAGQSAQIQVLVTMQGSPVTGATVTMAVTPAIASLSPVSGTTDGSGIFLTTLFVDSSANEALYITASTVSVHQLIAVPGQITYTGEGDMVVRVTPVEPPRINQVPVAQFTAVPSGGSGSFTLDATGSYDPDGAIVSYTWDFGDGNLASGPSVTHTYPGTGPYSVTLTVTDNEGARSIFSQPVGVAASLPPISVPVASPASGTVPLTVDFNGQQSSDPDGSIMLYAWDFGDGTQGQGPRTSHTYRAVGTFQATLTVTDNQGVPATSAPMIITAEAPAAGPTTPPATPAPQPTIRDLGGGEDTLTGVNEAHAVLAGILPPEILFLLSVLAGTWIAAITAVTTTRGVSRRLEKGEASLKSYLSSSASGFLSRFEVGRRKLGPVLRGDPVFLGLTPRELAVLFACAGAYTLAFLLKDRLQISMETLLILVAAGAITTLAHQVGHHEAARRIGQPAELQFWGLGTLMLVLSSLLFGYLFASPSRNLFQKVPEQSHRSAAIVNLAGPAMSVAVAILSLLLFPLGGMLTLFGRTLFSLNLMNGVYSLVPFDPMDGKPVYEWNRTAWAAVFFPLLAVYAAFSLL